MQWLKFNAKPVAELVRRAAACSRDTSTKVGAAIMAPDMTLVAMGHNDLPLGVKDTPERRERPKKYLFTEHAERVAIYSALRQRASCDGCVMFVTHFPCADCARAIIQAGIEMVVHLPIDEDYSSRYKEHIEAAGQMLAEAGVSVGVYCDCK